jgi:hypothetical protein
MSALRKLERFALSRSAPIAFDSHLDRARHHSTRSNLG